MVIDRIITYLTSRGWTVIRDTDQFLTLSPPQESDLPAEYSLVVPKTTDHSDFTRYYNTLLQIFSDFYEFTHQGFDALLGKDETILRVRIYDQDTVDGKINFVRFEGFIERLRAIITDTASFVIDKSLLSARTPAEAQRYLNKCNFLQTEKGSYVTNIQLPSNELIKDAELFERGQVFAEEINEKLMSVLDFVSTTIFTNAIGEITDDYIIEREGVLNLKLLKDIETFYEKSDIRNVEFSLHTIQETKKVETVDVTKQQIKYLHDFIEEVGKRGFETKDVTVRGQIERLFSKDPEGNKNTITMPGLLDGMPVVAKASLDSEIYKKALQAHGIKEWVTITGEAKVARTRVSFTRIDNLEIG
jgi:hypothetical protein